MRYKGQGWEIPVRLGSDAGTDGGFDDLAADLLAAGFTKAYEEFFGRAIDDLPIEAVSWSVRVASIVDPPPPVDIVTDGTTPPPVIDRRPMFDPIVGAFTDTTRVERAALPVGAQVDGPAVIVEDQTTTVLASHHRAVVQTDGALVVRRSKP